MGLCTERYCAIVWMIAKSRFDFESNVLHSGFDCAVQWYDVSLWSQRAYYDMIWYPMIWYDMILYDMMFDCEVSAHAQCFAGSAQLSLVSATMMPFAFLMNFMHHLPQMIIIFIFIIINSMIIDHIFINLHHRHHICYSKVRW